MKNIMINNGSNERNDNNSQLELGFSGAAASQPRCGKNTLRRRHSQASVWFRRMRQIVDSAQSPEVWSLKLGVSRRSPTNVT